MNKLRIATRNSPLALWQTHFVANALKKEDPSLEIELLPLVTSGDRFLQDKLLEKGGKGLFVKELEEALLQNRADLAVHSMKDMPNDLPEGLLIASVLKRDNPHDAFVSVDYQRLQNLPPKSVVGTSSLRRQSQLLALRPDLTVQTLRGNIQTRLSKLDQGHYSAIILAAAGLERMGLESRISEELPFEQFLPACAQGAIGIECRADQHAVIEKLRALQDEKTARCVRTERLVNAQLGGNCHVPLAVYCQVDEHETLHLKARVLNEHGSISLFASEQGRPEEADKLAKRCSDALLAQGADKLLKIAH